MYLFVFVLELYFEKFDKNEIFNCIINFKLINSFWKCYIVLGV